MELSINQDALQQAAEALSEIFEKLSEIFRELARKIVDVLTPYLRKVMKWAKETFKAMLKQQAEAAGLERCFHLAYHARKARTRKKNIKRILESMEDEV